MSQTTMTFRTDSSVKDEFSRFCADVGMNATVAINMFMRATIAQQELPFRVRRITAPPAGINLDLMSKDEIAALLEARASDDSEVLDIEDAFSELEKRHPL
jgi:DNA-damage-inducible protein J